MTNMLSTGGVRTCIRIVVFFYAMNDKVLRNGYFVLCYVISVRVALWPGYQVSLG